MHISLSIPVALVKRHYAGVLNFFISSNAASRTPPPISSVFILTEPLPLCILVKYGLSSEFIQIVLTSLHPISPLGLICPQCPQSLHFFFSFSAILPSVISIPARLVKRHYYFLFKMIIPRRASSAVSALCRLRTSLAAHLCFNG